MLLGRGGERAAIEALLARARAGRGGGLLLSGEPGIGKTTLLSYAELQATGMRVLHTMGVEPESGLGYATLHRLMMPLIGRLDRLPAPQANALGVVFGRTTGPGPDRFLVALAVLSLLSDAAGEQPLVCVVDDAHWADAPSLDVLAFVARRLEAEPIALALAARDGEGRRPDATGLEELPLAGLDHDSALALLADHSPHADELVRATGGNPLAILTLQGDAGVRAVLGEPVPLTAKLQQAFLERARPHRPFLLLVAADGSGRLDVIRRAADDLGIDMVSSELLDVDGVRIGFRHPLVRSAVYHAAGVPERRAAHRALAMAFAAEPDGLERHAWHLGQAADRPDEDVASVLQRSAEEMARRAGPAAAALAFERAAQLSVSGARRPSRMVAAARAWWDGGDATRARTLLAQAETEASGVEASEAVRLDIVALRALIDVRAGTPSDAVELLTPMLPTAIRTDPPRAFQMLALFGEAAYHANVATGWSALSMAAEQMTLTGSAHHDLLVRLLRAVCQRHDGVAAEARPDDLRMLEELTEPAELMWTGGMLVGIGEQALARRLHRRAVERARTLGAAGTLAWVLEQMVAAELNRNHLAAAEAHAEEGLQFAEETGQPNVACRHRASLALIAALRGQREPTQRLSDEVLVDAGRRDLASTAAVAYQALGMLELGAGGWVDALAHFEAIDRGAGTHPGIVLRTAPDRIEAAIRSGRTDKAGDMLERLARWADPTTSPDVGALVARCRALLETGDEANATYKLALSLHDRGDQPLERARTQLLFGEHLRRERRRVEARDELRAAATTFQRLGASGWAARASQELRAAGEAHRDREQRVLDTLTPQERRIIDAVAEGATNREIAARLFLSPRTVDYHLRKVFQKLGVTSRTALVRRILADGNDQGDNLTPADAEARQRPAIRPSPRVRDVRHASHMSARHTHHCRVDREPAGDEACARSADTTGLPPPRRAQV